MINEKLKEALKNISAEKWSLLVDFAEIILRIEQEANQYTQDFINKHIEGLPEESRANLIEALNEIAPKAH